ncbi:MAG: menaquinol oxidoreductase [Desulfuromonadales bacterium]|nr:menaquinol oxidoreductase [Desulfuromonadales bacterium]
MADPMNCSHGGKVPEPKPLCREARKKIRKLQARASRGLWALALFVAISIGAMRDFSFIPSLPQQIRDFLGMSPPTGLISAALVVYTFSAVVLVLSRMTLGLGEYSGFAHVGYLTAFYGFYHFAGALQDNFWAVFAAGMTVLGLESYHIWTHYQELVKELEKFLPRLNKTEEE